MGEVKAGSSVTSKHGLQNGDGNGESIALESCNHAYAVYYSNYPSLLVRGVVESSFKTT